MFAHAHSSVTAAAVNSPVGAVNASPKPNTGAIAGGVVGAIALVVIVVLVVLFLKRQRGKEMELDEEPEVEPRFTRPFNNADALVSDNSGANLVAGMQNPYKRQGGALHEPTPASTYIPGGSGVESSPLSFGARLEGSEYYQTAPNTITSGYPESVSSAHVNPPVPAPGPPSVPHLQVTRPNDGDGASTLDRRTYYTLPSYHERVVEGARGRERDLSEADVNAISQRLREFMRQSGGPDLQPPRELIDHLVEEQLRPREG